MSKWVEVARRQLSVGLLLGLLLAAGLPARAEAPPAPGAPLLAPAGQIGGFSWSLAAQGHYLYQASGAGIAVLDVADPTRPVPVGQLRVLREAVTQLLVDGTRLYAVPDSALYSMPTYFTIVDVADAARPRVIAEVPVPGLRFFAAAGDYVYASTAEYTLTIIDVADPAQPHVVATHTTARPLGPLAIAGGNAYVVSYGVGAPRGLWVVDITDPTSLQEMSFIQVNGASGLKLSGHFAHLRATQGTVIADVTDPAHPVLLGTYGAPDAIEGLAIAGTRAYYISGDAIHVVDIADPSLPTETGVCPLSDPPSTTLHLAAMGEYAYLAGWIGGLKIIDATDPTQPSEAGAHPAPGWVRGVQAVGTYAYVADWLGGLHVVDISRPAEPRMAGSVSIDSAGAATPASFPGYMPRSITLAGHYAYLADWDNGLHIIDVADPSQPTRISGYPHYAAGAVVSGTYAYLAGFDELSVLDVSSPLSPTLVLTVNPGAPELTAIAATESLLVLNLGNLGLAIYDITNPVSPTLAGVTYMDVVDVVAADHRVYLTSSSGLRILDISDPAHLSIVGGLDLVATGPLVDIQLAGDHVSVADLNGALYLISIADPAAPYLVARYDVPRHTGNSVNGAALAGSWLYVSGGDEGLVTAAFIPTPSEVLLPLALR